MLIARLPPFQCISKTITKQYLHHFQQLYHSIKIKYHMTTLDPITKLLVAKQYMHYNYISWKKFLVVELFSNMLDDKKINKFAMCKVFICPRKTCGNELCILMF
jgi:hypothetical protein